MATPPINLNSFFLGLQDTPSSYADQAGRIPMVNPSESGLQYINYNKVPMNNGVISGGQIAANATNPLTQVDVAAGTGRIIDPISDVTQEAFTNVNWLASTITILQPDIFGAVAIGVDSAGTIQQFTTYSPAVRKENVILALVYYADGDITRIFNIPNMLSQGQEMFQDYLNWLSTKDKAQGLAVRGVTSNLQVWRDSGTTFIPYARWNIDPQNPHQVVYPQAGDATTPINVTKIQSNDTRGASDTVIPLQWDNAGTLTALTGTEATIHYCFMAIDGTVHILQYGQSVYPTFDDAIRSANVDADSSTFFTGSNAVVLLAQVFVSAPATEFDNVSATIRSNIDAGGAGGVGAVTDFLSLTDTPSSYIGNAGQGLVVDPTESGLVFDSLVNADGTIPMDVGYVPTSNLDVVTKEYADALGISDWAASTAYTVGTYIRYAPTATLYRCEITHTSTPDFVADLTAGNWSHLTGYINTAREFQGGLNQQTAYEQVLYMRDNTTPRTPISVSTPGYRDDITPVVQNPPMTVQSTWNLTSNPLLGTASTCDPSKFERRHVSFAGTYFTVGDFIAFGPDSFGPFGDTRWEILRVGRTAGDNYHYCEVSPDNCNVPCQQSPSAGGFQTYRPTASGYIDPLAVTAVTDIGGGEFQIDLDDAHDKSGTAVLDDAWAVGHAIMQFDVDDPATYFVIKSIPSPTSVICEPSAALPTTLISNPAGWLPTVGMNLKTTGVAAPLARVTPAVIAVTDLGGGFYDIQYDTAIDGTGLNWTVGHAIVPLSDTSGNTYLALQSFTAPDTLMMDANVSFPQFYVPAVGIQMDTSGTVAQPLPTLGEEPRVPVLDGELVNKKYVDDNSAGGVLTGRHTGPITVNASQYIRLAGPFTPTSGAHFELHWQFSGGEQAVVVGSWAGQFSAGQLRIESNAGSAMGGSYIDTLRIRRADSDGGLYIGYVLDTNQVLESLNINIKYTQQGNQVPTTHFVVGGFGGTDLASVTLPARTDFRPYLQPALDGQALNSGSHAYIGAWTAPAEIPEGTLCAVHFSIGFTLGGTAEYTWWLRISTETDKNARGSGSAEVQSLYRGYCAGMLYFTVPAGKRVEFHLRLDGNSGHVQADSGNGRSVFLIQPYQ